MATKTLYIGNLSYGTTEANLISAFENYGGVNARLIEGRGFAFVDINAEMLDTAIAEKHQTVLDGRTLVVSEARPKSPGALGKGYGGGKSRGQGWG